MLSTSVLDRFSAPLCDEVIDGTGSAAMLTDIERSNSFLIALDNRREWYRYHHLFRELLRNELASTDPAGAVAANRRAATLAARPRVGLGGDLAPRRRRRRRGGGRTHRLLVAAVRPPPVRMRPFEPGWTCCRRAVHDGDSRLCVASAVMAISTGRLDEVGRWIDQAARAPAGGPFHDGFRSGAAAADCLRTVHAWLLGDLGACRAAGEAAIRRATSRRPGTESRTPGSARPSSGSDTAEEGSPHCRRACAVPRRRSFHPPWIACLSILGLIHHLQGDQDAAREFSEEALALSARSGLDEYSRLTTAAHITRAGLLTGDERREEARTGAGTRGRDGRTAAAARWRSRTPRCRSASPPRPTDDAAASTPAPGRPPDRSSGPARIPGPVVTALLERAEAGLAVPRRADAAADPLPGRLQ